MSISYPLMWEHCLIRIGHGVQVDPGPQKRLLSLRPEVAIALKHTRTPILKSAHNVKIQSSNNTLALISSSITTSRLRGILFTWDVELRPNDYKAPEGLLEQCSDLRYVVLPEAHHLWREAHLSETLSALSLPLSTFL
jgi:hypothetical protein